MEENKKPNKKSNSNNLARAFPSGAIGALKVFKAYKDMGLKCDGILNPGVSKTIGEALKIKEMAKPFSGMLDNYKIFDNAKLASDMKQITSMAKTAQESMTTMSSAYIDNYNNILSDSIKNLAFGIEALSKNIEYHAVYDVASSISKLGEVIEDIEIEELPKELEEEINWQEVENIANEKIQEILVASSSKDVPVESVLGTLTKDLLGYSLKDGIAGSLSTSDNLVQRIILQVAMWLISTLLILYCNKAIKENTNKNQSIKIIKKELKALDVYNNLISESARIVTKDKLEVRYSNKMKCGVKNYLNFGSLVKVEHKNKNWTKVSYTNLYTDENEIGWVLTRYIKKLD